MGRLTLGFEKERWRVREGGERGMEGGGGRARERDEGGGGE